MARRLVRAGVWALGLWLGGCSATPEPEPPAPATFERPAVSPNLELLRQGDKLFRQEKFLPARRVYARAAEAAGPRYVAVEACAQVARMDLELGQPTEGEPWLRMAMARARMEEPPGWSRLQQVLGIYERQAGQVGAAVNRFTALYDYCLKYKLYDRAVDAAQQVILSSSTEKTQIAWSKKGIEAAELGGMSAWLAATWDRKAVGLEAEGRAEELLLAREMARNYHYERGGDLEKIRADWALGRAQRGTGRLEEARETQEGVLLRSERLYAVEPSAEHAEWIGRARWELGELDALEDEPEEGLANLRRARERLVEAGIEKWGERGMRELWLLDARIMDLENQVD